MQSEKLFFVKKAGLLTTFQDTGRTGYQRFGVPVSGAMDQFALQVANILVGNRRNLACMEVTFVGPELEVCATSSVLVAITGADLEPKINGQTIPMWQSFYVQKGDVLSFGKHKSGVRAYIAVAGGYDVPTVFSSQSTDIQSGFGEQVEKSTYLKAFIDDVKERKTPFDERCGLVITQIPAYKNEVTVSVIEGPHTSLFTKEGYRTFFKEAFTVDTASNRMGYRLLSDEKVSLNKNTEIWSDAVPFGGIQVPKNGQPIILMADRQTTGGYPRIGTVLSTDIVKIAQLVPNGIIRFRRISIRDAQKKWMEQELFLHKLATFRKDFKFNRGV